MRKDTPSGFTPSKAKQQVRAIRERNEVILEKQNRNDYVTFGIGIAIFTGLVIANFINKETELGIANISSLFFLVILLLTNLNLNHERFFVRIYEDTNDLILEDLQDAAKKVENK